MNIDTRDDEEGEFVLNMTPMVDIVFNLLMFFLLSSVLVKPERELEVDLPAAESASERAEETMELVLSVDERGRVFHHEDELDPSRLQSLLSDAARRDRTTPVTIRGHRDARHETIVRVMDACGRAGLANLSLGTSPERGG